jgi:hypothetical protein
MRPECVSTAVVRNGGTAGTTTEGNVLAARFWGKWAGACGIGFREEPGRKGKDGTGCVVSERASAGRAAKARKKPFDPET